MSVRARATNLPISTKHAVFICRALKGKTLTEAETLLKAVMAKKVPIRFKGEIPHKRGRRIAAGRFPVKAASYVLKTLRSLEASAKTAGMSAEKARISLAKADKAARPERPGRWLGRRFKRTHLTLEASETGKTDGG